jgi:Fic family protein
MNILKKKKGKEEYYYLKYSFRRGNKIINKEKYVGKTIPKDIEQMQETFLEECRKEALFDLFFQIHKHFQKEWKSYPKSMQEKVKQQLAIDFTYNSNAIEGSTITQKETQEIVEHHIAPHKPLYDVQETELHAKVFLALLDTKEKLDNNLILKWHQQLFYLTKQDMAGKFREYGVRVGSYTAPDWQDVKKLMQELIQFYHKNKNMHPVLLAARMHYKFESIHPFGDGNGRVGRLLMSYILWHARYPILIIEYKKRQSYYKVFPKGEEKFVDYFVRRYLKAYKKYLRN